MRFLDFFVSHRASPFSSFTGYILKPSIFAVIFGFARHFSRTSRRVRSPWHSNRVSETAIFRQHRSMFASNRTP